MFLNSFFRGLVWEPVFHKSLMASHLRLLIHAFLDSFGLKRRILDSRLGGDFITIFSSAKRAAKDAEIPF